MTEQKGKGYQGIRAVEATEYENIRSDFRYCDCWEKWKTICQTTLQLSIPGTQRISVKVTPDDFTDEPEFQCDVQVVKNTFVDDSK